MNKDFLIESLFRIEAVKFGSFTLKSGLSSPIYLDLRVCVSYPDILRQICQLVWTEISTLSFDCICGVPYTALPIATGISLSEGIPMVMRRKEVKDYGTKRAIEGHWLEGQRCLIVEDLITSGISVCETIEPLQKEGLEVTDVVVLIDRQQGGKNHLETHGYQLHAVLTISEILDSLSQKQLITSEIADDVRNYITHHQAEAPILLT